MMSRFNKGIAIRFFRLTALVAIASIANATMSEYMNPSNIHPSEFFTLQGIFARDSTNSVLLSWTAPREDGASGGAVTSYEVRSTTDTLSESTWSSATVVGGPPTPTTPGSSNSMFVDGLWPNTTYAFGIKSSDEAANVSALSNVVTYTTSCVESWSCSGWTACADGQQSRTCTDQNQCGTLIDRPAISQVCSCVEQWDCGEWSGCLRGRETRTCVDEATCGTTFDEPENTQACVSGGVARNPHIVTGLNEGDEPRVRVFEAITTKRIASFRAYESSFRGGVNVAVGDIDGNGVDEIVTGPGPGRKPEVRVFTKSGRLVKKFNAFSSTFRGGVNVAIGDFDNDGKAEIVVGPASKGVSRVRVFSLNDSGVFRQAYPEFFAYSGSFRGEVSVAAADMDGNGSDEILTVPGAKSGGPHIRVFTLNDGTFQTKTLGFLAYSRTFTGGVSFATGDIDGDGADEVLTAPITRGGPHIRIFGQREEAGIGLEGPGFFAFSSAFRGGVSLATVDIDGDAVSEIAAAVRSDDVSLIRIYRGDGKRIIKEWQAFPDTITTGVKIGVGFLTRD